MVNGFYKGKVNGAKSYCVPVREDTNRGEEIINDALILSSLPFLPPPLLLILPGTDC